MFDGKVLRNVDPQKKSPFRDPDPFGDGKKTVAFDSFLGEHLPISKMAKVSQRRRRISDCQASVLWFVLVEGVEVPKASAEAKDHFSILFPKRLPGSPWTPRFRC